MATASGKDFWSHCGSAQCDKAAGGGRRYLTAKDATGRGLCAQCGKAAGESKRPLAADVFGATDTVQERMALTSSAQLAKVAQCSHKALHTAGGHVKGGSPEAVTKAVQAKLPKVAKVAKVAKAAPKVKAPKVAPKVTRKRPVAKTA